MSGGAGVLAAIGLFASLADQLAIGAGLLSLAVSIFVIGLLCQILAALRLIAHRMQR